MNVSIVEPQDLENTLMIAEYLECKKFAGIQEHRTGEITILNLRNSKSYIHLAVELQVIVRECVPSAGKDFYPCLLFWD